MNSDIWNPSYSQCYRKHGNPYDRGGADSYYDRTIDPHWWPNGTSIGNRIEQSHMTLPQVKEYYQGYYDNESAGDFKDWGDE